MVGLMAKLPFVAVTRPNSPLTSIADILPLSQKRADPVTYASGGTGTVAHLAGELFALRTGARMQHIPYRGAGPALNDTVAGQVPVIFDNLPSALPFIKDNRLVPIVVAAPQRLAVLPNVPTFKEVGLEPVNRMAYYGLLAPRGTKAEVIARLHTAAKAALAEPAVVQRIQETGSIVVGNAPAEFERQIREELEVYRGVVRAQRLRLEE